MLPYMRVTIILSLAVAACAVSPLRPFIVSRPPASAHTLDRRVASLSIEFSYLPSFGGNDSVPNELTRRLIQQIVDRTGVGPDVRPGGITVDSSVFDPTLEENIQLITSPSGGIYKTVFGPAYFEALNVFPQSSRIIWSVNLGNDTIGFAQAGIRGASKESVATTVDRSFSVAALDHIGLKSGRLIALELGNEADQYNLGTTRPKTWASADYTSQFLGWTSYLTRNLSLPHNIFVAGGFAIDPTSAAPMTTRSIIADGVETLNTVKLYAQHTYQYSTCDPVRNAIATLQHLVDHSNITAYLDLWKPQIAAAHAQGREFIVGEYNSVSCSGKQNVTDGFGQALWVADTVLYGASIGIARMHLHQGATLVFQSSQQANSPGFSWYDLWYPTESDRFGAPHAAPSFVAYLFIAEAVGHSLSPTARITSLALDPTGALNVAGYAIYEGTALARVVLLNMSPDSVVVDLGSSGARGGNVKRMTGGTRGLAETDAAHTTWAGQSFSQGLPVGALEVETSKDGQVSVGGAEAVIVFLH